MIGDRKSSKRCSHCDLPVPAGLVALGQIDQFCCSGCKTAYGLIHAHGLQSFYSMAESESGSLSVNSNDESYSEFDEDVFLKKYAKQLGNGDLRIELAIDGIHCAACIWLIEKLPKMLPGIKVARVNWGRRTVVVDWDRQQVELAIIAKTLHQLGYQPTPIHPNSNQQRWQAENRTHLVRIGIAAACAGNNMMISAALYLGMFSHMTAEMTQLMRMTSGIVGLVAFAWPGRVFLTSALASIRTRTPHMDLPIALALFVGTVAGIVNVFRGSGEIYFDSISVLVFLLLVGRWIQFRQQAKAASSVDLLQQLRPMKARKIVDGHRVEVLVELIQNKDHLEVHSGEVFPVDGELIEGTTLVDESILTGEAAPVLKTSEDTVFAGTTNVGPVANILATKTGSSTRLAGLVELVEQASSQKPQMVLWANQIGGYFVFFITMLAVFTFFWWAPVKWHFAVERTVALLVVACPCALALATPLAIAVALGRAAKRGIMVKSGDVFQSLQTPGVIWLDKTGTMTAGNLRVKQWFGHAHWLPQIAGLEKKFAHPVADAFVEFCDEGLQRQRRGDAERIRISGPPASASKITAEMEPGLGVCGSVDDVFMLAGSERLMNKFEIPISNGQKRISTGIVSRGGTPCWVAVEGRVVGIAELADKINDDTQESIEELQDRGWQVGILSGDHQDVVSKLADRLGIETCMALGGVAPEGKLAEVKACEKTVVMIGDGVNDSAALAAADVGIAVKKSAEASLLSAPVYFAKPGLSAVLELLDISNSTTKTMRLNLAVSLFYNIGFAALAFLGHINPLVAAIVMPISSMTVIVLSMNSGRIRVPVTESTTSNQG